MLIKCVLSTHIAGAIQVDIHTLINKLFKTFPPFSINKRYKLIIFAPNVYNVDKLCLMLKLNK